MNERTQNDNLTTTTTTATNSMLFSRLVVAVVVLVAELRAQTQRSGAKVGAAAVCDRVRRNARLKTAPSRAKRCAADDFHTPPVLSLAFHNNKYALLTHANTANSQTPSNNATIAFVS